ncbi:MAG: PilW family protein [Planctomycetota bacterium]|jgi:prepilin-type N-terminal cleavage/methylation domain-containing protein
MFINRRLSSGRRPGGFTLVELLVALSVSSIILGAVAALAFAVQSANDTTDDTERKQAQVRYATLRISDLVRHSKLICYAGTDDFVVWKGDANGDGLINSSEIVCVEKGSEGTLLRLGDFPAGGSDPTIDFGDIGAVSTAWWSGYGVSIRWTTLIPECGNVEFSFDALPPWSRYVNISFDLVENGISRNYEINGYVRGWGGNLVNDAGNALVSDDD